MKNIAHTWSRETITEAIKEAAEYWHSVQPATVAQATTIYTELKSLCFVFLEKFCLYPDQVQLFRDLLTDAEIEDLKNINSYNYHKIKMKK